jgi:hypothetical protein
MIYSHLRAIARIEKDLDGGNDDQGHLLESRDLPGMNITIRFAMERIRKCSLEGIAL